MPPVYLWSKVVLFLFCHVTSRWDLPNYSASCTCLVSLESSQWEGCIDLVWDCFGAILWKLLIIEPFSQYKVNKIENEKCIEGISWCCWKALGKSDLIGFISQFSELRCERYWFLNEFFCCKFIQITEIGFGRKNQLSPQCVHIAKFRTFQFWKCEK